MEKWKFDKNIAGIFDKHVIQSVTGYEEIQKLVCNLSEFFIKDINEFIYDIGCGTGETIKRLLDTHQNKQINFIGIDTSADMILKARDKLKETSNIKFINKKIQDIEFENKSNFIISVLTLQFVDIEDRCKIIKKIYNNLNLGGAFIFVEKIYSSNSQIQDIFNQIYYDFKIEQGLSSQEILDKSIRLKGALRPLTHENNIKLLKNSGFKKIDVFFKDLNFIGYIAIK